MEELLQVLPMLQTMDIPSKRDQYRIQEVLDAATFLLHVSNQYIDPDFSYEKPEVFITEDEILQYLCSGSRFENGKYQIWNFCKENHLVKEISEFLKNEYGNGSHNSALSGDSFPMHIMNSKGDPPHKSWLYGSNLLDGGSEEDPLSDPRGSILNTI